MLSYGEMTELVYSIYSQAYPALYEVNGKQEAQIDIAKIFYNLCDDDLIVKVEQALREYAETKGITV